LIQILHINAPEPVNPSFAAAKPRCVNRRLSVPARLRPASESADAVADHLKRPDIAGFRNLRRGNAVSAHEQLATKSLAKRERHACMAKNREVFNA
jgi:hypothetical protein